MSDAPLTPSTPPAAAAADALRPLVRHTRCEGWGRGLLLWEKEGKRGYLFEDGTMRVIAESYFGLLEPAKKPDPLLRHKLSERARASGLMPDGTGTADQRSDRKAARRMPSLVDQVTVFEGLYEGGFEGTAWTETHRNRDGRRVKKLREPAIVHAAERLSRSALQECLDAGDLQAILQRVVEVVGETDLATRQQLAVFDGVHVDRELAEAMFGFLHDERQGELEVMARLRRALARHDIKSPAWTVITAPRALLYPADHMCVRPSVVRTQAKHIMPRYKPGSVPSADDYARCLELAMTVREHLTKAGFAPRDLFDVTDFMKETLSASVKDKLTEAMLLRQSNEAKDA